MNSINTPRNSTNILPNNQNIIDNLQETFGENVKDGISETISQTQIAGIQKLNAKIGGDFISSCFHPDEFGIGSYRPTSLVNLLELSESLQVKPEVLYLDTLNSAGLRGFPNVQTSKKSPTVSKQISVLANENLDARTYFQKSNEIFDQIMKSSLHANQISNELVKYLEGIFAELGILEQINAFLQENNCDEKTANAFKNFILQEKIFQTLQEIKNIFTKNLLQKKYKGNISQAEIFAEFQNAILTLIFQEFLPKYMQKLEKNGLSQNGIISLEISYNNPESVKKYSESIKILLEDENLGEEIFLKYFHNLLERSQGKPVELLSYGANGREKRVYVHKENGIIQFIESVGKNHTEISQNEFFSIITSGKGKLNFSGAILLFLACLGGQFHIGSERGIRELVAETLKKHLKDTGKFDENAENYIKKVILGLNIFDTFEEGKDNSGKNLAGSAGSYPSDMLKMLFIGGEFAKDQLEKAKNKNDEVPEINEELLLKSLENCIKSTYEKIQNLQESERKNDILRKFYDLHEKYNFEKNISNFLELVKFCFDLDKYL